MPRQSKNTLLMNEGETILQERLRTIGSRNCPLLALSSLAHAVADVGFPAKADPLGSVILR